MIINIVVIQFLLYETQYNTIIFKKKCIFQYFKQCGIFILITQIIILNRYSLQSSQK